MPQAPVGAPAVDGFSPAHAFAGSRIAVRGRALGRRADSVEVQFGSGGRVRPASLDVDGSRLEVVVPEDARSGPLVVSTEAGRAASAAEFVFDGAGRLRRGRVAARARLSPPAAAAFPLEPSGDLLVLVRGSALVLSDRTGATRLLPVEAPQAAVPAAGGTRAVVLATESEPAGCVGSACTRSASTLRLLDAARLAAGDPASPLGRVTVSEDRPGTETAGAALAANPDGSRALLVAPGRAWVADLEQGRLLARHDNEASDSWIGAAFAGGGTFLLAEADAIRPVDDTGGAPGEAFPLPGLAQAGDAVSALAARPDGQVAAGTLQGRIVLLDAASWPPTVRRVLEPGEGGPSPRPMVSSLAFSDDGRRLAAVQPFMQRVSTFDAAADGRPLGAATLERPGEVVSGREVFFAAALGSVALLSQESGVWAGAVSLRAEIRSPRLRRAACGANAPERPVIEVARRTFHDIVRLDPDTLELLACRAPLLPRDAPPVDELAALPQAGMLYLRAGSQVRRVGPGDERPAADYYALAASSLQAGRHLAVSPDGGAVLLETGPADGTGVDRVAVLDPAAVWFPGMDAPVFRIDGESLVAALDDGAGHLVLAGSQTIRVLESKAARHGEEKRLYDDLRPGSILAAGLSVGRVFVVSVRSGDRHLDVLDPAAGKLAEGGVLPQLPLYATDLLPSPGGRRLWWLDWGPAGRDLVSLAVDPETGGVGEPDPRIDLPLDPEPFAFYGLYAYPDGEHLVVSDAVRDQILLLE